MDILLTPQVMSVTDVLLVRLMIAPHSNVLTAHSELAAVPFMLELLLESADAVSVTL